MFSYALSTKNNAISCQCISILSAAFITTIAISIAALSIAITYIPDECVGSRTLPDVIYANITIYLLDHILGIAALLENMIGYTKYCLKICAIWFYIMGISCLILTAVLVAPIILNMKCGFYTIASISGIICAINIILCVSQCTIFEYSYNCSSKDDPNIHLDDHEMTSLIIVPS